jgi:hypothetical protein
MFIIWLIEMLMSIINARSYQPIVIESLFFGFELNNVILDLDSFSAKRWEYINLTLKDIKHVFCAVLSLDR